MSAAMLEATLALRDFLFEAVYENDVATAEFAKAEGILGGLWEHVQRAARRASSIRGPSRPRAWRWPTQDFIAGMTDRYAVGLFEQLFIPKPWVGPWPVSERSHLER